MRACVSARVLVLCDACCFVLFCFVLFCFVLFTVLCVCVFVVIFFVLVPRFVAGRFSEACTEEAVTGMLGIAISSLTSDSPTPIKVCVEVCVYV